MSWVELAVAGVPARDIARWSDALFAAGAAGVQEDYLPGEAPAPRQPWDAAPPAPEPARRVLRAWFDAPEASVIEGALRPHLRPAHGFAAPTLAWSDVPDTDWETSWQAGFEPIIVGPLTVAAPWHDLPGALIIEPGQGFGTGTHPTTRAMLHAVVALAPSCRTALDVGCGSGILALAAARLGCDAYGIDNHAPSVRDAQRQAVANGLERVRFDDTPLGQLAARWDLVLANLHAELLVPFADDLRRVTGDWLCLAGIMAEKEATVRAAYDPHLELVHRDFVAEGDSGWVHLRYRRRP